MEAAETGEVTEQVDLSDLSYLAIARQLDQIIQELDKGQVDVDTLDIRFSQAVELVEELNRRINRAKMKVEELTPRLKSVFDTPAGDDTPTTYDISATSDTQPTNDPPF
ncbi:MAG: exodeoxyribonuclease VII small subunit [Actinobacteria bacterium]|jgi:exodeoxyribonuclease VII small subunit|nr:exodeoxyribonuclease VII small subunit [Actinomycetota bacterium]